MGESERREGQVGASEAGALPEGAAIPSGSAADPAQRLGVQGVSGRGESSVSLDLQALLDEPEQLIHELKKIADAHPDSKRWTIVSRMCIRAKEAFDIIHRAPSTPIARESGDNLAL